MSDLLKELAESLEEIRKNTQAEHAKIDRQAKYFNIFIWVLAGASFLSIFLRLFL